VGAALLSVAVLVLAASPSPAADGADITFQNVVVRRGDTLWGIANTYLKDPSKWDQVLKYNRLPSNDPTVALPGMTLKVPVQLIKENMRAAQVIYLLNRVLLRKRDTADWGDAKQDAQVYRGDALHTLENAKAKVKFLNGDLLSVDPNSMAVIKPPSVDYDVELKSGAVFTGHARVLTASAKVTPRTQDTQYSAKVNADLSTLVEVYKGRAGVEGGGKTVEVPAGMASEVKMGLAPTLPKKIADLPEFEARAAEYNGERTRGQARLKVAVNADIAYGADATPSTTPPTSPTFRAWSSRCASASRFPAFAFKRRGPAASKRSSSTSSSRRTPTFRPTSSLSRGRLLVSHRARRPVEKNKGGTPPRACCRSAWPPGSGKST